MGELMWYKMRFIATYMRFNGNEKIHEEKNEIV